MVNCCRNLAPLWFYSGRYTYSITCASKMSWQCFLDKETGSRYKSRLAVTNSLVDLNEYQFSTNARQLCEAATTALELERKQRLLWEITCGEHTSSDNCVLENQPQLITLLVSFDKSMLPCLQNNPEGDHEACRQDSIDDYRQREADSVTIEVHRRSIQFRLGQRLVFVFAYTEESKQRILSNLRSGGNRILETPRFYCMDDFLSYLTCFDFSVL